MTQSKFDLLFLCNRKISKPLDLVMAVVDLKGTTKEFCSTTCLCYFKTKHFRIRKSVHSKSTTISPQIPPSRCSLCNKTCSVRRTALSPLALAECTCKSLFIWFMLVLCRQVMRWTLMTPSTTFAATRAWKISAGSTWVSACPAAPRAARNPSD